MRRTDDQALNPLPPSGGACRVGAHRIAKPGAALVAQDCWVVEEEALFLEIAEVGLYTLMWTRTDHAAAVGFLPDDGVLGAAAVPDALALCAGFLVSEGMIAGRGDIAEMAVCANSPNVVQVRLADPQAVQTRRRSGFIVSSCGICGGVDQRGDVQSGLPRVGRALFVDPASFMPMMQTMRSRQNVFGITGGTHAAALFSSSGEIIATAEDLGRHNALDKVIGQCLLREIQSAGCGVLLSGRVSLELIIKAARAGIEVVAAVSAPSSLAIDAARQLDITLCGFVRDGRATAFTHPERLI